VSHQYELICMGMGQRRTHLLILQRACHFLLSTRYQSSRSMDEGSSCRGGRSGSVSSTGQSASNTPAKEVAQNPLAAANDSSKNLDGFPSSISPSTRDLLSIPPDVQGIIEKLDNSKLQQVVELVAQFIQVQNSMQSSLQMALQKHSNLQQIVLSKVANMGIYLGGNSGGEDGEGKSGFAGYTNADARALAEMGTSHGEEGHSTSIGFLGISGVDVDGIRSLHSLQPPSSTNAVDRGRGGGPGPLGVAVAGMYSPPLAGRSNDRESARSSTTWQEPAPVSSGASSAGAALGSGLHTSSAAATASSFRDALIDAESSSSPAKATEEELTPEGQLKMEMKSHMNMHRQMLLRQQDQLQQHNVGIAGFNAGAEAPVPMGGGTEGGALAVPLHRGLQPEDLNWEEDIMDEQLFNFLIEG
jgi:hypothetical protein